MNTLEERMRGRRYSASGDNRGSSSAAQAPHNVSTSSPPPSSPRRRSRVGDGSTPRPPAKPGPAARPRARPRKKAPVLPARSAAATFSAELMRAQGLALLRGAAGLAGKATRLPESTARIVAAFMPLTRLLARETPVTQPELSAEIDRIFELLYAHPLTEQARRFTSYLRGRNVLPNEGTTENLIRYVVQQAVARSPIPVPQQIVDEFWAFFHELMAEPELRGLADGAQSGPAGVRRSLTLEASGERLRIEVTAVGKDRTQFHLWREPIAEAVTPGVEAVAPADGLTSREREVALLVSDGLRSREVAERLGIASQTVKSHLKTIFDKLGVRNRVELARRLTHH